MATEKESLIVSQVPMALMTSVSSGSTLIDELFGGYEPEVLTVFYGPAGSGKTLYCLMCCASMAKSGKKIMYIDTDGGFSPERLVQLAGNDDVLSSVMIMRPSNFAEQHTAISKINKYMSKDIGLIVLDSLSMLYRLELSSKEQEVQETNRALARQLGMLKEIALKWNIPVLITNQVYSDFEKQDQVKMVSGDVIDYAAKCLVELQKVPDGLRRCILRKHRQHGEKELLFKIVQKGIVKGKQEFKLF